MEHSNKINQSGRFIMDLSQAMWKKFNRSTQQVMLVSSLVFLSACSTLPSETPLPADDSLANITPEVVDEKPLETDRKSVV